jgi:catechol 2,3-dioxygenase-like lactoylglutathione lyase family enzyme
VHFYTELLGFQTGLIWPTDSPTFAILQRDEVEVQFHVADTSAGEFPGHGSLSIDVSDAEALHACLHGRVTVEWGPEVYSYGRREFAVRDPDGYLIIFSEPTLDPPTCAQA